MFLWLRRLNGYAVFGAKAVSGFKGSKFKYCAVSRLNGLKLFAFQPLVRQYFVSSFGD